MKDGTDIEGDIPWLEGKEFDYFLAGLEGVTEPEKEYEADPAAWSAYWEKSHAIEKTCPVELVTHCSGECPMYILAIKESVTTARRGYPEVIRAIPHKEEWGKTLIKFCQKAKIEYVEPEWLLCSYWH